MCIVRFFRFNRLGQKNLLAREQFPGKSVEDGVVWALETLRKTTPEMKEKLFSVEVFGDQTLEPIV